VNDVQIIKTHGEDLVVLSRRDYDALLARAGDEAAEDAMSLRILAETRAQTALPANVMDRIIEGENPVAVLLEHRKLTQAELALLTGLSQSFISKIARGKVGGRRDTIEKLCAAFHVSADVLVN
jgi:DNA-binding Xre family transcriptional regulator